MATLTVGPDKRYPSLPAALNAARPGDMIEVDPDPSGNAATGATPGGITVRVGRNGETSFFERRPGNAVNAQIENAAIGIPGLTAGTLLATRDGLRRIEEVKAGDAAITRDRGYREILWAGRSDLPPEALDLNPNLRPVFIPEGAIGNTQAMTVSPRHGFLVNDSMDGLLTHHSGRVKIRAIHLVDRVPGVRMASDCRQVSYFHILLGDDRLILSDGIWSESFYPEEQVFANLGGAMQREVAAACPHLGGGTTHAAAPNWGYLTRRELSADDRVLSAL